jgi:hypothetical protein
MESYVNNKTEYESELIKYFPTVIAEMILSYVGKYNLQYVDKMYLGDYDHVLNYNEYVYIHNTLKSTLYDIILKKYYHIPSTGSIISFIGKKKILIKNDNEYIIFDLIKCKTVKNIKYIEHNTSCYRASNNKYIIFITINDIIVHNTNNMKMISSIKKPCGITRESEIIHDTFYGVDNYRPRIIKYNIVNNHIEHVYFDVEFEDKNWASCFVKIINHDIIMFYYDEIFFYDSDGYLLHINKLTQLIPKNYYVTLDHMYFKKSNELQIYKRII